MAGAWKPQPIDDVPDGLILFDGVCVLCSYWVRFVIERDTEARFRFAAVQSLYGIGAGGAAGHFRRGPRDQCGHTGRAGPISNRMPRSGDIAPAAAGGGRGCCSRCRGAVRNWAYDRVARSRYRLFGRTDACLMPTPELTARFIHDARDGGK